MPVKLAVHHGLLGPICQLSGVPLSGLTRQNLQEAGTVFQIGVAPRRIDIMTTASGLEFDDAFNNSVAVDIEGIPVHIPSINDLIRNKKAVGRTKDLADAEALKALRDPEQWT